MVAAATNPQTRACYKRHNGTFHTALGGDKRIEDPDRESEIENLGRKKAAKQKAVSKSTQKRKGKEQEYADDLISTVQALVN